MQKAFYNMITKTAALLAVMLIGAAPSLAQVTISLGDAAGKEGQSVSVPVRISGVASGSAIQSYGFFLSYDSGITFTGHSVDGTLSQTAGFTVNSSSIAGGQPVDGVGGFAQTTNITSNGILVYLNFDLDSESTGSITLTPDGGGSIFNAGDPAAAGSLTTSFTVANRIMAIDEGSVSTLVVGEEFEIIINLEDALLDADDAIAFNFDLNYDADLMTVTGVSASGVTANAIQVSGNHPAGTTGLFRVGGFTNLANEFVGDGEFLRISATASSVNNGVGSLSLSAIQFNAPGAPPFYAGKSAFIGVSLDTADEDDPTLPSEFSLKGNYPNPFNPSTTIQFDLPETADVQVQVSDLLGRQVLTIPSQTMQAGSNRSVQINASSLASGIYVYRVIARGAGSTFVRSNTMTLIK